MSDTLVLFYSSTGNSRYIAHKIAQELEADIEEIKSNINPFFMLLLTSQLKKSLSVKPLKHDVASYRHIVLCGPVWMGSLVSPLRAFVRKYKDHIQQLTFVTGCGTYDGNKDEKYGYKQVFNQLEAILGDKLKQSLALPVVLTLSEEQRGSQESAIKVRLDDNNFSGEIDDRFQVLIEDLKQI